MYRLRNARAVYIWKVCKPEKNVFSHSFAILSQLPRTIPITIIIETNVFTETNVLKTNGICDRRNLQSILCKHFDLFGNIVYRTDALNVQRQKIDRIYDIQTLFDASDQSLPSRYTVGTDERLRRCWSLANSINSFDFALLSRYFDAFEWTRFKRWSENWFTFQFERNPLAAQSFSIFSSVSRAWIKCDVGVEIFLIKIECFQSDSVHCVK